MPQVKNKAKMTQRELLLERLLLARDFLKRLWRSPSARIGGIIVLITVSISIGVPTFNDYDARRDRDLPARYAEPVSANQR